MTNRRKFDRRERVLPHDLSAETSLIGGVLIDNSMWPIAASVVTSRMFFRDAHRRIWAALERLAVKGCPLDLVLLKEDLDREGDLEDCGGPSYISALLDGVPRSVNVKFYGEIVREKATYRELIKTGSAMVDAAYTEEKTSTEVMRETDLKLTLLLAAQAATSGSRTAQSLLPALSSRIEKRVERKGQISGLPTGFPSLDIYTHGWQPGHLIVIGGRTSHGKSALALNFATTIAKAGKRVMYFSFEMGEAAMMDRLTCSLSVDETGKGVTVENHTWGTYSNQDWSRLTHAQEQIHAMPTLEFDFEGSRHIGDIERTCRAIHADRGLDAAVVDHFQLLDVGQDENRATQLAAASRRLQQLAGDLGIVLFVVSQLTIDEKETHVKPDIHHIRDCKSLGQDAHGVLMLDPYDPKRVKLPLHEAPSVLMRLYVRKQREGPLGYVWLEFERDYMRFVPGEEPKAIPKPVESKARKMATPAAW